MAEEYREILITTGTIVSMLLAVIGWFIKRELNRDSKSKEDFNRALENLKESIDDIVIKMTKLENITSDIESLAEKLETIDRDGATIKHELELLGQMIKPLFDLKDDVNRSKTDIGLLYSRIDSLKEDIHRLEKEIYMLKRT